MAPVRYLLVLGTKFRGYQKNLIIKINNILMQYVKLTLMQNIHNEQNIKNLQENTIIITDFSLCLRLQ